MKTLEGTVLPMLLLTVMACQSPEAPKEPIEKPIERSACEEVSDYDVFSITAELWQNAWNQVLLDLYSTEVIAKHQDFIQGRAFERSALNELLEDCPTCTDVRIYFADRATPPDGLKLVPDLLMVNANGCEDVIGNVILLTDSAATYSISLDSAQYAILRWQENWPSEEDFLTQLRAYTYERETIVNTLEAVEGDSLNFAFTMHASSSIQSGPSGQSPNDVQGFLVVDLLIDNVLIGSEERALADFARPCPELCDFDSPLYDLEI